MSRREPRFYPGHKGERKRTGEWISTWVKPKGKFWKRNSNKKIRKSDSVSGGGFFKKVWGWFEWS
jgi:hypothetical protein